MDSKLKKQINKLKTHSNNPLYVNSFFIMLTFVVSSGIGFVFWILAAKVYSAEYVGLNTALISSMTLIASISLLGFDQSIIRFFPEMDKSRIFSTSLIVTFVFTTLIWIIYIEGIDLWSPDLSIIKDVAFIFYIFLISNVFMNLSGSAFLALRKSKYYFVQNVITGSRLLLLFPFIIFGSLGIFNSFGVSFTLATIFSLILLYKLGIHPKKMDKNILKKSYRFSAGNYLFGLLTGTPSLILSIVVLNVLGAEQTAYYYISLTIVSVLYIIPSSFSTSVFVEGSHGEPLRKNVLKSIYSIAILLIPSSILLYILAPFLLSLIGSNYLNALGIFRLMILTAFGLIFYNIFISIKKIQKDMKGLLFIGILYAISLLGLSYVLMLKYGLIGVGYAWIFTYGFISVIMIIMAIRDRWI